MESQRAIPPLHTAHTIRTSTRLRRARPQDVRGVIDGDSNAVLGTTFLQRLRSLSSRWPSTRLGIPRSGTFSWVSVDATNNSTTYLHSNALVIGNRSHGFEGTHSRKVSIQTSHASSPEEPPVLHQSQSEESEYFSDDETVVEADSAFAAVGTEIDAWTMSSLEY